MSSRPFKPLDVKAFQIDFQFQARVAHALEFIAEQLSDLNERLANEAAAKERAEKAATQERLASLGWPQAPGGTQTPGR